MLAQLNLNFERQLEKTQKEHDKKVQALNDEMKKEREASLEKEKGLRKKIEEGLAEVESLKQEIARLSGILGGKDGEIKAMQERVKEAEDTMKQEKKKAQERVHQVEREYNEKERVLNENLKQKLN
jgi:chromosome segregation ATPase